MTEPRARERTTAAFAAAVFLFAFLLRARGLGSVFPLDDEIMQFHEALSPSGWGAFLAALARNPHHVLLDPLGTRLMSFVSGSLWALRLPSALLGAGTCWLLCRLGEREGRRGLGLAAGLLLAVNIFHVDWSRRADFYALLSFVSVWSVYEFLSVLDDPKRWPRLALAGSVFLLGHPYAVLMLIFQVLYSRASKAVLKAWSAALLIFVPWFLYSTKALLDLSTFDFTANPVTLGFGDFLARLPGALAFGAEAGPTSPALRALFAMLLAAGWGASLLSLAKERPRLLALSHALLGFGALAVVACDWRWRYYLAHRQLLWLLPFLLLCAADGWRLLVDRLGLPAGARTAGVALAAVLSLLAGSGVREWQEQRTAQMDRFVGALGHDAWDGRPLYFENDQLAAGVLFFFDRAAFAAIPEMRLVKGMLSYSIPEALRAARDGRTHPVVAGARCEAKPDGWMVCGSLYETSALGPSPALPGPR